MLHRRFGLIVLALLCAATAARADKLDKESAKWLEQVASIVTAEESKIYGQLKDRAERVEFEKIFWARRDPDIRTPENEAQQTFLTRRALADERYTTGGVTGSATGCGRLLILLGEPDSVMDDAMGAFLGVVSAQPGTGRSAANETTKNPTRQPQTWTYKDRADITFSGGEVKVAVDGRCAVPALVSANLERIAAGRILNPGLTYKVTDGRLVRLADLLPKPTPAQELLKSGRQDFPVSGQFSYYRAEGPTAVIGLIRADAAGLAVKDAGGAKAADVTVAAQAVTEDGRIAAVDERRISLPVGAEGGLATYRLFLRPGHYTLSYGVLDGKTGKGATASSPIEVPDLNGPDLSAGSLLVVQDVVEGATANPVDPMGAYVLGSLKLVPRFGNTFARSESAHFFYNVSSSVDLNGKANLTVGLSLLKGSKLVASTPSQSYTDPHVVTSVGPVPLSFEPGSYTARLKVKDNLTQKEATVDQAFVILSAP